MKSNKQLVYLIIFIAVILISIIGATYAYFESSTNMDNAALNSNVATANSSVFSAYSEGNIEFNITMDKMTQAGVSTNVIATDNATINITASSGNSNTTMACTYDLVWVWDSEDRYTDADTELPHYEINKERLLKLLKQQGFTGTYDEFLEQFNDGNGTKEEREQLLFQQLIQMQTTSSYYADALNIYNYELSVRVGNEEYDLSSLKWQEDGSAVLTTKSITSYNGKEISDIYIINVNAYNIPISQAKLFNKTFKAHIEIKNNNCMSVEASLSQICSAGDDLSECIKSSYTANGINALYLHDESLAYGANDGSYRYAGGEFDEAGWDALLEKEGYTYSEFSLYGMKQEAYYENTPENVAKIEKYINIIIKANYDYNSLTSEELEFMSSLDTEMKNGTLEVYEKVDLQKKLAAEGKMSRKVKNYVCFEGDDCTNEGNLYQILGIFGSEAKLVKYLDSLQMERDFNEDGTFSNVWEGSQVEEYLNSNETEYTYYTSKYDSTNKKYIVDQTLTTEGYLHSLGDKVNLIANHDWQVGGISGYGLDSSSNAKNIYDLEFATPETLQRKIGLVYLSDAIYATDSGNYGKKIKGLSPNNYWLAKSMSYWTITKAQSGDGVFYYGTDNFGSANVRIEYWIKPSFYLNANVKYKGGEGTLENPIIIGM